MTALVTYPNQTLDESTLSDAPVLSGSDTGYLPPSMKGLPSNPNAGDWSNWWTIKNPIAGQTIAVLPDVSVLDFGGGTGIIQDTLAFDGATLYQAYTTTQNKQTTVAFSPIATSTPQSDPILAAEHPGYTLNDTWEKLVIPKANSGSGWLNEFYLSVSGDSSYLATIYGPYGVSIPDQGRFLVTTGTITGARDAAWGNWQDVIAVGGGTTGGGGMTGDPTAGGGTAGDPTAGGGTAGMFPTDPASQIDFALSGVDPSLIPRATIVPSDTGHPQSDALAAWWDGGGESDFASGSPFSLIDAFTPNHPRLFDLYGTIKSLADGDLPDFVYNNQTDDTVRNLTTNFERDVSQPLGSIIKDTIKNSLTFKSRYDNYNGIRQAMTTYLNGLFDEFQAGAQQITPNAATLAARIDAGGDLSSAVQSTGVRPDAVVPVASIVGDHLKQA